MMRSPASGASRLLNQPRSALGAGSLGAALGFSSVEPLMDKALTPYVKGGGAKKYEEEPKQMTLDEWKAMQTKTDQPKFNLRKAGEG